MRSGDAPVPLDFAAKAFTVLHLIPRVAFVQPTMLDLGAKPVGESGVLLPLRGSFNTHRFNIDGIISADKRGHVQLFRNGVYETAEVSLGHESERAGHGKVISGWAYATNLFNAVGRYLEFAREMSLPAPFAALASLVGVREYNLLGGRSPYDNLGQFDRDTVTLPDVLIDDTGAIPATVMRPMIEALWQAAGFERCKEYGADGSWPARPR